FGVSCVKTCVGGDPAGVSRCPAAWYRRTRAKKRRRRLTSTAITMPVAAALEELLARAEEHEGRLAPADVADVVETHELDETEAESLGLELERAGLAAAVEDEEEELDELDLTVT